MPYISIADRLKFDKCICELPEFNSPGELNYMISILCSHYGSGKKLSYQQINDVMGALAGAQTEYYRRVAIPYEEQKIKLNGDLPGY